MYACGLVRTRAAVFNRRYTTKTRPNNAPQFAVITPLVGLVDLYAGRKRAPKVKSLRATYEKLRTHRLTAY